jgi:DNA-binding GntR family transcriptional regulator
VSLPEVSSVTPVSPVTKAEAAAEALREAIRSGRLPPGRRLTLQDLGRGLGMSYTPVREALRQLQSEGLVVHRAHYGTVVSDYSRARTQEVYRLRGVLEPLAGSLAAPRATDSDLDEVAECLARLDDAVRVGHVHDVPVLNAVLHKRIYAAAGSPLLAEFIERLWNGVPYQAISLGDRIADSAREHELIVAALRRRDGPAVAALLAQHITNGAEAALAYLDAMPDPSP